MPERRENLKEEKFWSCAALFVLLLSIIGFALGFDLSFLKDKSIGRHEIIDILIFAEGVLLLAILMLYMSQNLKIKAINAEKENALKMLENRLAAIEAAADGIGILNPAGNLVYMNSALKKLHGIPDEKVSDFIGKPWVNLYNESGREEVEAYVFPEVFKQGSWCGSSPIVKMDGTIIEAELSLKLLPDGSMIGTARDISDRQRAQEEKKQLEQQFYQAQKMEAVGRLAGGIAHDFNNILAAIFGFAEFIRDDAPEKSNERKFAENILEAGSQAKDLVDQMLTFSRYKQISKQPMKVQDPVKETLSMVKASFPKAIEVSYSIDDQRLVIDGNATQISQIIMNLCVNARDAMEGDKGKLNIELLKIEANDLGENELIQADMPDSSETPAVLFKDISASKTRLILGKVAKDKSYVHLKISDTGSGMSRTVMEHIFEPFFTTKSVDKGTGLGLATVHGVIISHQAALVVESELGVGTAFNIYFPLLNSEAQSNSEDDVTQYNITGARILLVEDQVEVREMMLNMLERMGCEADSCDNGLEALHVLQDSLDYYDLVLTDHNMPKMSGLELIQHIYEIDSNIPFILLSGYSKEKLSKMMEEHPAIKATLRKPIQRKDLQREIARVLDEGELKRAVNA